MDLGLVLALFERHVCTREEPSTTSPQNCSRSFAHATSINGFATKSRASSIRMSVCNAAHPSFKLSGISNPKWDWRQRFTPPFPNVSPSQNFSMSSEHAARPPGFARKSFDLARFTLSKAVWHKSLTLSSLASKQATSRPPSSSSSSTTESPPGSSSRSPPPPTFSDDGVPHFPRLARSARSALHTRSNSGFSSRLLARRIGSCSTRARQGGLASAVSMCCSRHFMVASPGCTEEQCLRSTGAQCSRSRGFSSTSERFMAWYLSSRVRHLSLR
mmetsp:Transcript_68518/g.128576  ORF Transcript_68518/g.128576 Transcript_68518/m.128576 type:complete len:273 (-) Transcript_68518:72-890(-)